MSSTTTLLAILELARFATDAAVRLQRGDLTEEELQDEWNGMKFSLRSGIEFFEKALEKRRGEEQG